MWKLKKMTPAVPAVRQTPASKSQVTNESRTNEDDTKTTEAQAVPLRKQVRLTTTVFMSSSSGVESFHTSNQCDYNAVVIFCSWLVFLVRTSYYSIIRIAFTRVSLAMFYPGCE